MDFSVQQLRMLREVSQRGTIAAAADALGYTPSAISQQLAALERGTGVAVLERVGRGVRLTDAGRELVRHADELLAGMEAAQAALESVDGEARGTVEMSVYESVASTLLPDLLDRLSSTHPDLTVRTRETDPDAAIDAVASGEIDVAFSIDYPHAPAAKRPGIERELVVNDHFHAVVPDDHPLTASVALSELANERFIASPLHLSCGRCVAAACRAAGFEPDVVHQLDDYPTTLRLVAAGQGIGLVPDLGLVHVPPGVRILDLETPVLRVIELAFRSASARRPAIQAIRSAVSDVSRAAIGRVAA
ncbi:MAG: LysR substrate-binding domain-containing protein [Actinomycetota bacterium]